LVKGRSCERYKSNKYFILRDRRPGHTQGRGDLLPGGDVRRLSCEKIRSPWHGPARRLGGVACAVRQKVYSPLIGQGQADFLLSTDEIERESYLDYLKPQSIDLIEYLKKGKEKIDNVFYLNTFMLGVLSKKLNISEENWLKALRNILPGKALAENLEVFNQGRELVK
jgi:indolepyruvate ferredoxin oxidoreductase beta subunit